MRRDNMKTMPGTSVRAEIDQRIAEARTAALEEAITFLGGHGHLDAADDLQRAAFGQQEGRQANG